MKSSFNTLYHRLLKHAVVYDKEALIYKENLLKQLSKTPLVISKILIKYQDLLLFLYTHSHSEKFGLLVQAEMQRLSEKLKKTGKNKKNIFLNSALPYTRTHASFTHDLLVLLYPNKNLQLDFDSSDESEIDLNTILSFTLPDIEKEYTTAGCAQEELFELLKIKKENRLPFLLEELNNLNHVPFLKDYLLDKFNLYVTIDPLTPKHSKLFNKIKIKDFYFHSEIIKKFDHYELLNLPLPESKKMPEKETDDLIETMQTALFLLQRETDPCTFIDRTSIRFYELERGISIALFGMTPERQLSLESYIGYTLFKNGYPAAYGGAWILGKRSLFGINIFESFRGGESGYFLCQLLRTYKQIFDLNYFEVEPYQYGLDNPEGIESGAFWFYYRYGFRPLHSELKNLALSEEKKIKSLSGYRSSKKTLEKFTGSNIGWQMDKSIPPKISHLRDVITRHIAKKYEGNRNAAIEICSKKLSGKLNLKTKSGSVEKRAFDDFSLLTEALEITSESKLQMITTLVKLKFSDPYQYNKLLTEFLK